jgi:hypothetical protein
MDQRALNKRDYMLAHPKSELSGLQAHDPHHCIIFDEKKFPELTCPENLIALTRDEHSYWQGKGYTGRKFFWYYKCIQFGEEHMKQWYENLPGKIARERMW